MEAAIICEKMGWSFQDYENTPDEFLLTVREMLVQRGIAQKEKDDEARAAQH